DYYCQSYDSTLSALF
nr:immunoglobulin light chain junction region [Macaca mulatta]MOX42472.1 immunoglobulin light chain junction region [Macaca mulatta]MOX42869.1 immunoglobulin light chain junction region [Macaca mulatta]MOX45228.1 immunoglobulin light chain junction region [Macaca mulatta]MOX45965.1 immunoglobulin light chain junction region [Macaca mulatta]